MTDILGIIEIIQVATFRIPKGIKNAVSISIAVGVDILIRNQNIISKECKTKTCFK